MCLIVRPFDSIELMRHDPTQIRNSYFRSEYVQRTTLPLIEDTDFDPAHGCDVGRLYGTCKVLLTAPPATLTLTLGTAPVLTPLQVNIRPRFLHTYSGEPLLESGSLGWREAPQEVLAAAAASLRSSDGGVPHVDVHTLYLHYAINRVRRTPTL